MSTYNAGTNRKAKDFNFYVHDNLKVDCCCYGNVTTIWDPSVVNGTTVVNANGTNKDSLIQGYQTSFENNISAWNFTKNAANPLVAQDYTVGGVSGKEYYPPNVFKDGVVYRALCKVNGEGWGYSSNDGVIWTQDGKFLVKGSGTTYDSGKASPNVVRYYNGTYYCFYSCYTSDSGNNPNDKIALATNTAWSTSGWVKNAGNPIYTVASYNSVNGTSYDGISLTDVVLVGNQWYYFGSAWNNAGTNADLCYGIGAPNADISNITLTTKICNISQINANWNWMQNPNVFKHPTTGIWYMTLTVGQFQANASTDNQAIYHFNSSQTNVPVFTIQNFKSYPIMTPDTTNNYENNYNYCSVWMKDINGNLITIGGNYCMYYAGHQNTATPTYTGCMCLATIASVP